MTCVTDKEKDIINNLDDISTKVGKINAFCCLLANIDKENTMIEGSCLKTIGDMLEDECLSVINDIGLTKLFIETGEK